MKKFIRLTMDIRAVLFFINLFSLGLTEGNSWMKFKVLYENPVSLICDNRELNLTDGNTEFSRLYWILPSGDQIQGIKETKRFFTSGDAPHGWNLTIKAVDTPDFGQYVCILVRPNNTIYSVKFGVNVEGPYYGDLSAKYGHQAMIGGIAGGSVLVLISFFCIVNHYKYNRDKADDSPQHENVTFKQKTPRKDTYEYENPTAVYEEEMKEIKPKKPKRGSREIDDNNVRLSAIYREITPAADY